MLDYQEALSFLQDTITVMEEEVYEKEYAEIVYDQFLPIVEEGEWAKTITFRHRDHSGEARWYNARGDNMPLADVTRGQAEQVIEMAAIGYDYSLEEIQQAMLGNIALEPDKMNAARFAYETFVDDVAFYGDKLKGWQGLLNQTPRASLAEMEENGGGVVRFRSRAGAAGGTEPAPRYWRNKTVDEIVQDVNDLISGIFVETSKIEIADTLLMSTREWAYLSTKRISDYESTTILEQIQRANLYTAQSGSPLTVRGINGLENAAVGGTAPELGNPGTTSAVTAKSARVVAYRRDDSAVKLHIPKAHEFLPPFQVSSITWEVGGIFRLGGTEVRRPATVRYLDEVGPEATIGA